MRTLWAIQAPNGTLGTSPLVYYSREEAQTTINKWHAVDGANYSLVEFSETESITQKIIAAWEQYGGDVRFLDKLSEIVPNVRN